MAKISPVIVSYVKIALICDSEYHTVRKEGRINLQLYLMEQDFLLVNIPKIQYLKINRIIMALSNDEITLTLNQDAGENLPVVWCHAIAVIPVVVTTVSSFLA